MKLAVVSHKVCWHLSDAPGKYYTDGGFPLQIKAVSELFDSTVIVVPCAAVTDIHGLTPLGSIAITYAPLSIPKGKGLRRKLNIPFWLLKNSRVIWREIKAADAVHAPIPGDVGTIGLLCALILRKPLFVRHCGNWFVQRTLAETFWRWLMERFAGGRNVMLATGGSDHPPSAKNKNIKWIFSTSITERQMRDAEPRPFPKDGKLRIVVACRQEPRKGTEIVIKAFAQIIKKFPLACLDVIGDGSLLKNLKAQAQSLGLAGKIIFHGKIEQQNVVGLMKKAHLFCFPTSASEGFPKVVLEALACGLPVVTTKVSVLPQLIKGDCGILLNSTDADALSAAVFKICSDSEVYEAMSKAAIDVARNYTLENWRDLIAQNLQEAWQVSSLTSIDSRNLKAAASSN
jgi:glycosyltransferase involved in cell wall biosynthesis